MIEGNGAAPAPRYAMSARDRRRFFVALAALVVLLFAGGVLAFVLDFRHHTICPGGAHWVSRTIDEFGQITYTCPNGKANGNILP
jgi:hypothetical protein